MWLAVYLCPAVYVCGYIANSLSFLVCITELNLSISHYSGLNRTVDAKQQWEKTIFIPAFVVAVLLLP